MQTTCLHEQAIDWNVVLQRRRNMKPKTRSFQAKGLSLCEDQHGCCYPEQVARLSRPHIARGIGREKEKSSPTVSNWEAVQDQTKRVRRAVAYRRP